MIFVAGMDARSIVWLFAFLARVVLVDLRLFRGFCQCMLQTHPPTLLTFGQLLVSAQDAVPGCLARATSATPPPPPPIAITATTTTTTATPGTTQANQTGIHESTKSNSQAIINISQRKLQQQQQKTFRSPANRCSQCRSFMEKFYSESRGNAMVVIFLLRISYT